MEQKNRMEGKNSSLTNSRLERLQMIGFRWAKRKGQASWNEKFVSKFDITVWEHVLVEPFIANRSVSIDITFVIE
jgi:hypothetical protein